ncbi:Non-heme chloroperoxidase [mine drainage metagenome]|uniref:Non-heme chloroperoxidase n=1 Tax=mine drainage metagenome TaxID=410659 RepID=A0A1J5S272_9ZZZZ
MKLEILHCQPPAKAKGSHPPLLFVHGSYCGAWIWNEFTLAHMAKKGYAAYAVSLRGHGGSEGQLTWASLEDYLADVAAAAGQLDAPPVVIGHSMGGIVAQHYASSGAALAGMVLMASVPPSGLASSALHLSSFAPDVLWQLGLLQSLGPKAVTPDIIHRAFFSAETPPEAVAPLLPKLQPESHRISAELLCPPQPMPRLGEQALPCLVLGGDADVFLPISAFRETATFWHADLEILHGAPHGLMLDHHWRQPSADAILAWLAKKGL